MRHRFAFERQAIADQRHQALPAIRANLTKTLEALGTQDPCAGKGRSMRPSGWAVREASGGRRRFTAPLGGCQSPPVPTRLSATGPQKKKKKKKLNPEKDQTPTDGRTVFTSDDAINLEWFTALDRDHLAAA